MPYDPDLDDRRSIRWRGYDYSQPGSYFVTLCSAGRRCVFGRIVFGEPVYTLVGAIVRDEWVRNVCRSAVYGLDQMIVMPNHLHAIVHIRRTQGPSAEGGQVAAPTRPSTTAAGSLGSLINLFKASSTTRVRAILNDGRYVLWQRGYYDHVIRSDRSLAKIRRYIRDNPGQWSFDPDNPAAQGPKPAGRG